LLGARSLDAQLLGDLNAPYWRLRDIGRQDVQQWVADRFERQLGWQTVRNAWTLLTGILETAVE
jgi:hypothetical protein